MSTDSPRHRRQATPPSQARDFSSMAVCQNCLDPVRGRIVCPSCSPTWYSLIGATHRAPNVTWKDRP